MVNVKIPIELPLPLGPSAQPQRINGSTALDGHNLFQPKNQQHNKPGPRKIDPYGVSFYRRDSQGCPTTAEARTMAKQCKEIRPNPSGQPSKPCSHSFPRPMAAGVKNVPSCLAKPASTGSPSPPISQLPNKPTASQPAQIKSLTPKQIRPKPSAQPRKPCSHSFPPPGSGPASKMSHPAWRSRHLQEARARQYLNYQTNPPRPNQLKSNHLCSGPARRAGT